MSCSDKEGVECDGLHQYGNTIAVCVYCMYVSPFGSRRLKTVPGCRNLKWSRKAKVTILTKAAGKQR